jgi:hypothetical protein
VTIDFDATFLKFGHSGGVKSSNAGEIIGDDDSAEFDYEFAPRYSLGLQGAGGLGIRGNFWSFDASAATFDGGFVDIEAYTADVEIFKTVDIGRSDSLEWMFGFRAAEFEQRDDTDLEYRVEGFGGTFGLEFSHYFGHRQRLFARGRTSLLLGENDLVDAGDLDDSEGVGFDNALAQIEIGGGWEGRCQIGSRAELVYGAGVEMHQWFDAVIMGDSSTEAYLADAQWLGFMARLGLEF